MTSFDPELDISALVLLLSFSSPGKRFLLFISYKAWPQRRIFKKYKCYFTAYRRCRHAETGAVLARSSQPEVGWLGWRCAEDESYPRAVAAACLAGAGSVPGPAAAWERGPLVGSIGVEAGVESVGVSPSPRREPSEGMAGMAAQPLNGGFIIII